MSEMMQKYINEAEEALLHTYNRYQIVLDKGDGVYLYDLDGKKYLDFCAGIAVFALGYGNKRYNDALKDQVDKLLHTSNYYYNVPAIDAARKIKAASGMDCYNRIVAHLAERVDRRSQFPSAKGKNFKFEYLGRCKE